MDFGTLIVGALIGWGVALVFDWLYYKQSSKFNRALDEAQDRIDALQQELSLAKRANLERQDAPPPFLIDASIANAEADRIAELESLLGELRHESADADRRAKLFEARLTDVSSELASLRYGLPTLDRTAEDELGEDHSSLGESEVSPQESSVQGISKA